MDQLQLLRGHQTTEHFEADSCAVNEGSVESGDRTLLKFTFNTPNIGSGSLMVGAPVDHPEWFVWDECHRHYHFREYADYRLWEAEGFVEWDRLRRENPEKTAQQVFDENPELQAAFVAGRKQGFCIIDFRVAAPTIHGWQPPDVRRFLSCGGNQGIGVGWADEYAFTLPGQWVDVTSQENGAYILEAEVNAERLYIEEDYSNNRGWIPAVVGADTPPPGAGIPLPIQVL